MLLRSYRRSVFGLFVFGLMLVSYEASIGQESVEFNARIRPLLNRHCLACHGPDEENRQADLRLDTYEGATEYAIVPGDAAGSDVFERIATDDEDLRMPPPDHADALKPDEVELFRKWIDQGAKYEQHWSFAPIKRPLVPDVSDPQAIVHNEIDHFILKRVALTGLSQNPISKPALLVRRTSLDLTGLPPAAHGKKVQGAIFGYLSDPSQESFSTFVDEILNSPAYAEHWASMWLDIARYADTCGYAGDEKRDIWPWRDWLIRTLDSDKSYKQMSIEMLAGDMLPGATEQQILATAFHRNTLSNNEGGTNDEEFRTIAVKDRLSTTLNAWMGLTVRCAECHSHKYDPINQTEYYQLLDFFNQSVDADKRDERPKLAVPQSRDKTIERKLNQQIEELKKKQATLPQVWNIVRPVDMTSRAGTNFELLKDDSILATGPLPGVEEYAFTFEVPAGTKISAIRLEAIPHIRHSGNVGRAPEGSFILSQIRFARVQDDSASGEETESVLPFARAANDFNQVNYHARKAIRSKVKSGDSGGWAVNHPVNGYKARREAIFELETPLLAEKPLTYKLYLLHDSPWKRLNLGCMRFSICSVDRPVTKYDKKELDPVNREVAELIAQRDAPIRVPVMKELSDEQKRETFVNLRGNFQSKGEKVSAAFPEAFEPTNELPLNRLGLAYWLFESDNPLTARVAVNRYWSRLMGKGIVITEEDFGTQGAQPSHPELLDYLATEFRDNGWDVRKLLKAIVMSATYQQSQQVGDQALELDPENRLLSRGPRVRLAAEVVRDQALAVSGLLSKKMYGQPVYPPSPIKRVVNAFTGGTTWQESHGEDRYRRAIYTFLKRSAPHPLFETFDMSTRDVCSMRRLRTNTPLQSFMTLNDIMFIEAARSLAEAMLEQTLQDKKQLLKHQINHGMRLAVYADADEKELVVLELLYRKSERRFSENLADAARLTGLAESSVGDLSKNDRDRLVRHAAMTVVANVILNLDSFLNN